eukprot:TRINITY_DN10168_c0_g1_i1.p1 TRINITY_DN10168_c0_g1~~TRINITY_DN10168_c0_g1_i1.p1  ORF type:complete len:310 (-),score=41.41 TRINITY_DN10168_c0_g1_i1:19-948(-)
MASPPKKRGVPANLAIASAAACGAVTFSNPMEVVKTRLQLQGELQKSSGFEKQYRGLTHATYKIFRFEGLRGIQRGLTLAYPYTVLMNGTRFGLYEHTKTFLSRSSGLPPTNPAVGLVSAATCGVVGSIIANPFYIAKTRLQSYSPHAAVGLHQHAYAGGWSALTSIYRENGIRGFFQGTKAACIRMTVASPTQIVSYEITKRQLLSYGMADDVRLHLVASLIAGAMLAVALNPFDVVTTRLYNQQIEVGKPPIYLGWIDCFVKTFRVEGFVGMYKGLFPHYVRLAPHTILLFVFLEQFRKLADRHGFY